MNLIQLNFRITTHEKMEERGGGHNVSAQLSVIFRYYSKRRRDLNGLQQIVEYTQSFIQQGNEDVFFVVFHIFNLGFLFISFLSITWRVPKLGRNVVHTYFPFLYFHEMLSSYINCIKLKLFFFLLPDLFILFILNVRWITIKTDPLLFCFP